MNVRSGALALFLLARAGTAATLSEAPVVAQFGAWTVHRGEGRCGATYSKDPAIELRRDALLIARKGGLQTVKLRFDSEPYGAERDLSGEERSNAAVAVTGSDFDRLSSGPTRLRGKIQSLTRGTWNIDIDLRGVPDAIAQIKADCTP